jgi:hypothetical protein
MVSPAATRSSGFRGFGSHAEIAMISPRAPIATSFLNMVSSFDLILLEARRAPRSGQSDSFRTAGLCGSIVRVAASRNGNDQPQGSDRH